MKVECLLKERGYKVNFEGLLFNPKGKEIGKHKSNTGYFRSSIRIKGKDKKIFVHRLQAYQKYGDSLYEPGIVVRHKNGNPEDNSKDNILIGTQGDNMMDISKKNRMRRSLYASSFARKYNREEVKEYHNQFNSYKKTMSKFGISSKGTLNFILTREDPII